MPTCIFTLNCATETSLHSSPHIPKTPSSWKRVTTTRRVALSQRTKPVPKKPIKAPVLLLRGPNPDPTPIPSLSKTLFKAWKFMPWIQNPQLVRFCFDGFRPIYRYIFFFFFGFSSFNFVWKLSTLISSLYIYFFNYAYLRSIMSGCQ